MTNHVDGKVVVITGAGGGFGRLVATKAAGLGARVVGADINQQALDETVALVTDAGGTASGLVTDVTDLDQMRALAAHAVEAHGAIDVIINNAGTMPLSFFADHKDAAGAWSRCIDINIKGVVNGISAVYDQMIEQGRGQVVNISSIYGNAGIEGSGVYSATKAAVTTISDSLRIEAKGKIKVTIIKPTGVPGTNLSGGVVNTEAVVGILGQNALSYGATMAAYAEGKLTPEQADPDNAQYAVLDPAYIADAIITTINQPWGVSLSDVTVRATGDGYVL